MTYSIHKEVCRQKKKNDFTLMSYPIYTDNKVKLYSKKGK